MDTPTNDEQTPSVMDWLNDNTDYQRCFVCGQQNPFGLHLVFATEDQQVTTEFTGEERHQGFPGVVHGGILAALLDETMGRVPVLDHRWVMTARLDLRYRQPALVGRPLRITARATDDRIRLVRVHGWISPVDEPNTVICEADGTFLPLPDEVREQAIQQWPGLKGYF